MPRVILSTAAVAAVLSTVAFTVATGFVALATSALACDCTNCSAQHCQPKPKRGGKVEYQWKVEEGVEASPRQLNGLTGTPPGQPSHQSGTAGEEWKTMQGDGLRIH
jgi:hypothetical protein